jgi:hypothetical protein
MMRYKETTWRKAVRIIMDLWGQRDEIDKLRRTAYGYNATLSAERNRLEIDVTMLEGMVKVERENALAEEQRQLVLLAIAKLSLSRPGFDYALREIAQKLHGVTMYESFKAMGPDELPEGAKKP